MPYGGMLLFIFVILCITNTNICFKMTFKRPSDQRSIAFEEIASETKLPLKEVEILIMKALAQGLVRGAIDEVAGVVNMTWVRINNMIVRNW